MDLIAHENEWGKDIITMYTMTHLIYELPYLVSPPNIT